MSSPLPSDSDPSAPPPSAPAPQRTQVSPGLRDILLGILLLVATASLADAGDGEPWVLILIFSLIGCAFLLSGIVMRGVALALVWHHERNA